MAQPASVIAREIKPGIGYVKIAFFPGVSDLLVNWIARWLTSRIASV
jgi:hypothetical protein